MSLFIETQNTIVFQTLQKRFQPLPQGEKPEALDVKAGDFDGCLITIKSTGANKEGIDISIKIRGDETLKSFGIDAALKQVYGDLVVATEKDQTATLRIPNVDSLSDAQKTKLVTDLSLIKRHIMAAPFVHAFDKFNKKEKFDAIRIGYRDEENMYIVNDENKNLFVVFSIRFKDADDIVLAKVFLQEFKDARKDKNFSAAPAVHFTQGSLPGELKTAKVTEPQDKESLNSYGFIVMSLFDRHMDAKNRNAVIDRLINFRSYFHYHLKCCKAYFHMRMRDRVTKLMQSLEACKDTTGKEKVMRTISGKTFSGPKR